jgi:hypothetical protein
MSEKNEERNKYLEGLVYSILTTPDGFLLVLIETPRLTKGQGLAREVTSLGGRAVSA